MNDSHEIFQTFLFKYRLREDTSSGNLQENKQIRSRFPQIPNTYMAGLVLHARPSVSFLEEGVSVSIIPFCCVRNTTTLL